MWHVPDNSLWNRQNLKSLVQFALKFSSSRCHRVRTCRRGRNLHLIIYVVIGAVTRDAFTVVTDPFTAWNCVSVREREYFSIPPLRDGERVISSNSGKANVLNSYFKSVFTAEVTLTIPSKDSSPFPDIADNFSLLLLYESRGGSSDFRLLTSNFRLPTSDFRLPTSDFQLPTSDFQLLTCNFRSNERRW